MGEGNDLGGGRGGDQAQERMQQAVRVGRMRRRAICTNATVPVAGRVGQKIGTSTRGSWLS
jgi:hypothetical protein